MTLFERALNIVFGGLTMFENDPGFGYRIYRLKETDEARIYRLPRKKKVDLTEPPPITGHFATMVRDPASGKLMIFYSSYPRGSLESVCHAGLGYATEELIKAPLHISQYLTRGKIPVADLEFAEAP